MTALRVEGVTKRRGGVPVLRGIDLVVPDGAIVALLGPSGCGKTTLLRLLAGFDRCDTGTITLAGTVVDGPDGLVPPERRGIGYVPQEGLLFPHLSVAGNVGFGLGRAARRGGRIDETLRLVGLDDLAGMASRQPHQLSGGQQQRVALARALAPRPRLVLLDEPFNGLDGSLRRSVAADVAAVLKRAGTTAVLVTHDPQEAFATADIVAVLIEGRIAQQADAVTLYRCPVDGAVARLTGPAIELSGIVAEGMAATALGRCPVVAPTGAVPDGPARIMLRPEQVVIAPEGDGVVAVVRSAMFAGDHTAAEVIVAGLTLDLRFPLPVRAGDHVRLAIRGPGLAWPA